VHNTRDSRSRQQVCAGLGRCEVHDDAGMARSLLEAGASKTM
jgi:hypothetical protein